MNMTARLKITYSILCFIIIILSLYLTLRQRDRMQYVIPTLPSLQDLDEVYIEQSGKSLQIVQFGASWQILPEGYPVDSTSMEGLLEVIVDLELTELVSVTGNYARYELDELTRIQVKALKGGKAVRAFDIGKRSPTYDHTYIQLAGDDRVFQTPGDIRGLFIRSKEDLRDKTVLSFNRGSIKKIEAQIGTDTVTLLRTERTGNASPGYDWNSDEGDAWETQKVDNLLATLSDLNAYSFIDQIDPGSEPAFSLELSGDKIYTLVFFERQDNYYPARTSQSPNPFSLFYALSENIIGTFIKEGG